MTKVTWKPGTMLSPLPPVLVSCGTVEKPNVMTVAWTGIICSDPVLTYVSIRPSRLSYEIIKEKGEFVINLPTWKMVSIVDYCGVKSGRDIDKFNEMNITAEPCTQISAPQINEAPLSIECKVKSITPYGTHDMFLAEVVAVNVDDTYIDEKGALDLEKAGILAYSHGKYYTLGRHLGNFGFSVNKAMLKQKQKLASLEVVEKKASPLKQKAKPAQKMRRTPFGMKPEKDRSKSGNEKLGDTKFKASQNKGAGEKDIIRDTISRPDKRYDKVKKVKTEYLKTESFPHQSFNRKKKKSSKLAG